MRRALTCRHEADSGLQSSLEAPDKCVRFKRLLEEANRAARKGLFFNVIVRGDHDHRHRGLACRKLLLEIDTTHARQLDVSNDARKALNCSASEKLLGRCEALCVIASRSDQRENSAPHGIIVVNNGDQSSCWHTARLSVSLTANMRFDYSSLTFTLSRAARNHTQVLRRRLRPTCWPVLKRSCTRRMGRHRPICLRSGETLEEESELDFALIQLGV
jgi:hypothetical protein